MPDVFDSRQRSEVMSRIRSKDTKPELLIRRALHKRGFRYRLHDRQLPGRPDIVLPRYRTVIQVRGCFWHQHPDPGCVDSRLPGSRRDYWVPKLEKNVARDKANDERLGAAGWKVLVVWECACTRRSLEGTVSEIEAFLRSQVE